MEKITHEVEELRNRMVGERERMLESVARDRVRLEEERRRILLKAEEVGTHHEEIPPAPPPKSREPEFGDRISEQQKRHRSQLDRLTRELEGRFKDFRFGGRPARLPGRSRRSAWECGAG